MKRKLLNEVKRRERWGNGKYSYIFTWNFASVCEYLKRHTFLANNITTIRPVFAKWPIVD
ncbi:hypothetical protein BDB01DRAFT_769642 [Pilobolus umbonatus]|nr:hypothetical protein BDB01DRAFT_769642 [Pilobolus umbonatus]